MATNRSINPTNEVDEDYISMSLHEMFHIVGDQMTERDIKLLKYFCVGLISEEMTSKVHDGFSFLLCMEKMNLVSESNFMNVLDLLRIINRHDLSQFVHLRCRNTVRLDPICAFLEATFTQQSQSTADKSRQLSGSPSPVQDRSAVDADNRTSTRQLTRIESKPNSSPYTLECVCASSDHHKNKEPSPPRLPKSHTPPRLPRLDTPPRLPGLDTPPRLPGLDTPPRLPGLDTPPRLPGLDTPPRLPGLDTPPRLPGLDTPPRLPGLDTPPRLPGLDTPPRSHTPSRSPRSDSYWNSSVKLLPQDDKVEKQLSTFSTSSSVSASRSSPVSASRSSPVSASRSSPVSPSECSLSLETCDQQGMSTDSTSMEAQSSHLKRLRSDDSSKNNRDIDYSILPSLKRRKKDAVLEENVGETLKTETIDIEMKGITNPSSDQLASPNDGDCCPIINNTSNNCNKTMVTLQVDKYSSQSVQKIIASSCEENNSNTDPSCKNSQNDFRTDDNHHHSTDSHIKTDDNDHHSTDSHIKTDDNHHHSTDSHIKTEDNHHHSTDSHIKTDDNDHHSTDSHIKTDDNHHHSTDSHIKTEDNHHQSTDSHIKTDDNHHHSTDSHIKTEDNHHHSTDSHIKTDDNHHHSTDSHIKTDDNHHHSTDSHIKTDDNHHHSTDSHIKTDDNHHHSTDSENSGANTEKKKEKLTCDIRLRVRAEVALQESALEGNVFSNKPTVVERQCEKFTQANTVLKSHDLGSIVCDIKFSDLTYLDAFWRDYINGSLLEALKGVFLTESLKQAVGHEAIKLLVNVDEDDYETGRIKLLQNFKK